MKFSQKQIKEMGKALCAIDITSEDSKKLYDLKRQHKFDTVILSHGKYGMNGGIIRNREDGKIYVITSRCGNLTIMV